MLEMARPPSPSRCNRRPSSKQSKLKAKLAAAGFRSDSSAGVFLGLKFIGLVVGLLIFGGSMLAVSGMTPKDADLHGVRRRHDVLLAGHRRLVHLAAAARRASSSRLPDALDLMVVCVEAGLGLDQAMRKVSEEMKTQLADHLRGIQSEQFPIADGPAEGRSAARIGRREPASTTCAAWRRS